MLRVRLRPPHVLLRVDAFDEVHVVFKRLLQPTGEHRKDMSSDSTTQEERMQESPCWWGAVPAAEERPDISAGWNWLHLLPSETGPVVSQDVVDPARQGLVTVAGDAAALVRVLQVHTAVRLRDELASHITGIKTAFGKNKKITTK